MATIRNAITMTDKMSPVFTKMAKAMTSNLQLMEKINVSSKRGIDNAAFKRAHADIDAANNAVKMFNNNLRKTKQEADGIKGAFGGVKGQLMNIYAGVQLAKQGFQMLSNGAAYLDNLTSMKARANLINDRTQSTPELQDKMAAAAIRSRADYGAFASSTVKMNMLAPDAFQGNDDAISFMETLNKMFVISGASAEESTAAMYQLTQAMASGRLQGDEFRSIIENAPMLKNALMDSLGVGSAELKQMSTDGELTASVIKQAMSDAAESVNEQFASMPMTFGQAATNLGTIMARGMQGVSDAFSEFISSTAGNELFSGLVTGIELLSNACIILMESVSNVANFIVDNWNYISPIVAGILAVLTIYFIQMGVAALIAGKKSVVSALQTAGAWMLAHSQLVIVGAAIALVVYALYNLGDVGQYVAIVILGLVSVYALWVAAQKILNGEMWACPITWILVAVVALVAMIFLIVEAVNNLTGSSLSAIGVIAGALTAAVAFVWNLFAGFCNFALEVAEVLYNIFADFANFFANFLNDPVAAVVHLIADLVSTALGLLKGLAEAMDAIFGSNMADAVNGWQDNVQKWANEAVGEQEIVVKKFDSDKYKLDRWAYTDAYNTGYDFGENLQNSFSGFSASDILDQANESVNKMVPNPDGGRLDEVGKIKDDVTIDEEDIKLLKDIATTKFVNKYSTLQPNLTVQFGDVYESSNIDKNRIIEIVDEMATEAYAVAVVQEA